MDLSGVYHDGELVREAEMADGRGGGGSGREPAGRAALRARTAPPVYRSCPWEGSRLMLSRRGVLAVTLDFLAAGAYAGAPGQEGRPDHAPAGGWPGPRQNRQLTAIQPLAGRMATAPGVVARVAFPRDRAALVPF